MANIDAALMEEVVDIAKRARKPDMHKHAKLDDPRHSLTGSCPFYKATPCPNASIPLSQTTLPFLTNTPHIAQQGLQ